jgi:Domain of unknown function (DUF4411)
VRYSIDTSSLISGFRDRFPYEVIPAFWNRDLPNLVELGDLRATEEVKEELRVQDDELLQWTKELDDLFVEVDADIQREVRAILRTHGRLIHAGRSGADPFVIALARINDCTVVCEEGSGSERNPKIPDVCSALGLRCIRLIDLVLEQGWMYG